MPQKIDVEDFSKDGFCETARYLRSVGACLVDGMHELACSDADAKTKMPSLRNKRTPNAGSADTSTKNAKSRFVPKKWPVSGVFA